MARMKKMFSQRHEIGRKTQVRVLYDVNSLLWFVGGITMLIYVATYVDYDLTVAVKAMLGIVIGLVGIVMSLTDSLGVGSVFDFRFTWGETMNAITSMVIGVVFIFIANIVTQQASGFWSTLAILPIGATVFSTIVGINEEPFVHGWLLNWIENATGDTLAGVFISSAIAATVHLAIYAVRGMSTLVIVFASFFILGVVYAMSTEYEKGAFRDEPVPCRRISPLQNAHGIVNATAGLRAAMIALRCVVILYV